MPLPPIKVFVSYALSEEDHGIEELDLILSQLQNQTGTDYRMDYWFDRHADENRSFSRQAKEKLLEADLITLLICPAYFYSDYINRYEKPLITQRLADSNDEVRVIPVVLAQLAYDRHWVYPLHLETIPRNYLYPTLPGRSWEDVWDEVGYKLHYHFEELHETLAERAQLQAWRQEKLEGMKRRKLPVVYWVNPIPAIIFCTLLLMIYWSVKTAQTREACLDTPYEYSNQDLQIEEAQVYSTQRSTNCLCRRFGPDE